ncbi:GPR15 protein, partial [Polypterus senegalus]
MEYSSSTVEYETYYYENDSTEQSEGCRLPAFPWTWIIRTFLYILVVILGVPGNIALIWIMVRRLSVFRRPCESFVVNLAISDLLLLLGLLVWIDSEIHGGSWRSGWLCCKITAYFMALSMQSGIFFLTAMSIDRYLAVVHSNIYRKIKKKLYVTASCFLVWLVSILIALPVFRARTLSLDVNGIWRCREEIDIHLQRFSLVNLLAFFFSLLGILYCYCSIMRTLCLHYRRTRRQNHKLQRSIKVVFLVVVVFCFSWVPFNVFKIVKIVLTMMNKENSCTMDVALTGLGVLVPFAFSNSCANPFIYTWADASLKKLAVRCLCPCLPRLQEVMVVSQSSEMGSRSSQGSESSWHKKERQNTTNCQLSVKA